MTQKSRLLLPMLATLCLAGHASQAQQHTAIGDGLTWGVTDTSLTVVPASNRGRMGAVVLTNAGPDVQSDQLPAALTSNPDVVTLTVGANDALAAAQAAVADPAAACGLVATRVTAFRSAYNTI